MKLAEKIIGIILALGCIMNFFLIPGGVFISVIMLMLLSNFYFYLSFLLFNQIRLRDIFKKAAYKGVSGKRIVGAIGAGIALSSLIIGLLFKIQSWPGTIVMIFFGFWMVLIVALIAAIKYMKNKSNYYKGILTRSVLFGCIGILFVALPGVLVVEIKYRNYPGYVQAYKEYVENPENDELRKKLDAEADKVFENTH